VTYLSVQNRYTANMSYVEYKMKEKKTLTI